MSSSSDSFLQKTTEELLYLVQHPELYHPALVAEAGRELRRRGTDIPRPQAATQPDVAAATYDTEYEAASPLRRWWPAGLIAVAVGGLAWWGLRSSTASSATTAKPAVAKPIVLEAVKADRMPDFENETARQVATIRRQLPAADRADTTATGRYARTARRYWLAENAAAYLTKQAQNDSASALFPNQIDLTLERISWFMKARAYDQHLHPIMEAHLTEMEQGLTLRRASLQALRTQYSVGAEVTQEKKAFTQAAEAADIGRVLLGQPSQKAPIAGNLASLGSSATAPASQGLKAVKELPKPHRNQNPLYVVDGELLASDAFSGEAPAEVRNIPPDNIESIVVLKRDKAVLLFGPRAHDGAIVVTTKAGR
ncbi:TonB-dependent receptor plug domain-containing protein [Hymenobacter pini]|uniref:TonB-dependent receptor plug domain-containing protein n=1 Tax=Hymenobacter pini TaxID=2880879 RepID=UPI001CF30222|nr:TonB-dependent receptor plug domain-containing protein [Hymenobacter pini]MCA8829192.1 TonB-dependent receptor plug domain-containing protein [Hymenobacter pini]